ncbi:MAG: MFS transporter [Rhizobiaceae bacterium]
MTDISAERTDWRALWASGDLARFCFVSLGILLHATNETMVATIMPAMVRDLSGVELVGWSLAIYELGAIVAGAAAGRLVSYVPLRTNMAGAALVFALGAAICAAAPNMPAFLAGRLMEGLGGGALVSLAFVSVERLFPPKIWPQLFGIMSVVWGVAAFGGPLVGAIVSESLNWRWAFGIFTGAGIAMALTTFLMLTSPQATTRVRPTEKLPPFPIKVLLVLGLSVMAVASAGVNVAPLRSSLLLAVGIAGLVFFFRLDSRNRAAHLFPDRLFDWSTPMGGGMVMVSALSLATCSLAVYGPLLLTTLHGFSVLTSGWIIATESIAWSATAILVAGASPRREPTLILLGAVMIAAGVAGFAYAVPNGSLWSLFICAGLQGGGFGLAWPFVTRVIVAAAPEGQSTIASSAVPTMQRIGYATGSALTGIVANVGGFSQGLSRQAAESVAVWVFLAFVPLALVGVMAAARISQRHPR